MSSCHDRKQEGGQCGHLERILNVSATASPRVGRIAKRPIRYGDSVTVT